ncbi:hypothetical protein PG993_013543 [Apiospora rasikravindrae]|uniref:Uncharacterized protein n=1 Tax=Apiospora rasikravindrae TaxID=990691 RepID=A0ABR1RZH9_9PEZI
MATTERAVQPRWPLAAVAKEVRELGLEVGMGFEMLEEVLTEVANGRNSYNNKTTWPRKISSTPGATGILRPGLSLHLSNESLCIAYRKSGANPNIRTQDRIIARKDKSGTTKSKRTTSSYCRHPAKLFHMNMISISFG